MIPDAYWRLARRWFWLIAMFTFAGAVSAPFLLPSVIGASSSASSFDSNASLTVAHYVSPTGLVLPGGGELDDDPVANYTTAIAAYAETEQFLASVQEDLAKQGSALSRGTIANKITIVANRTLFRIDVSSTAETMDEAEALVQGGADALIARASSEEAQATLTLIADLEEEQQLYLARLEAIEAAPGRFALITELELQVIRVELKDRTWEKERLLFNRTAPLSLISSPVTVEIESSPMPTQDLLLLGTALGLVMGWVAANFAEHIRPSRGTGETTSVREIEVIDVRASDPRLPLLARRATEIERRAKALQSVSVSLVGEPPRASS